MIFNNTSSRRARGKRGLSLLAGLALFTTYLAIVPSAVADPAPGPGAESRATAGALPSGTIPDGTCGARVTAIGGGGASSPTASGFGGIGGAGASISATFKVLPGQTFEGSVGGGGTNPTGGTGNGAVGFGGDGGTIVVTHRGGGGGGRTTVDLGGATVVVAGGGGGGGAAHQNAPAGGGGIGGFTGIGAGVVALGSTGGFGVDGANTVNGGGGGQAAAGGSGGTNTGSAPQNGAAGGGVGVGTGGNGGPDPGYDSGGGGGGGYTGGGGGASTVVDSVTGGGGGGGSSWVSATSPITVPTAPTAVSGAAGTPSPGVSGSGATGSIAIDWIPCLYGLAVTKTVSSPTVNAGGVVTWTVTVTNVGPDPMTRGDTVALADLLPAGPNGAPAPEFEVTSMTVSGGANADMDRGAITCTGVAVGSSMPTATICSRPYNAPLAPQAPTGGVRGLDPGEAITISYEQIIANTAGCDTITNTATVSDRATQTGTTDMVGVIATRSASESLTINCYDLAIAKTASPTPVLNGGTITWTITVTNNGPADMEGPTDTDPNPLVVTDTFPSADVGAPSLTSSTGPAGACSLSGSTITCASGLPAAGQQILTFTQSVDAGAADGTVIANTASVSDPTTGDTNDSSTDQTSVVVPVLTLAKSADPATYAAVGDVISYDYLVTNSGSVPFAGPVTVADDQTTVTCPAVTTVGDLDGNLDPGESLTCTASSTIVQADLNAGSLTNTATASADGTSSNQDTATVNAAQGPALSLVKSASPATFAAVGDVISYDFVVTNSGSVPFAGPVTVADDQTTVTCPAVTTVGDLDGNLDPGESLTCTASSTIVQADLNAGSVTNTASASADGTTSNTDTATVNAAQGPALSLVKSASPATFAAVGDVISYDFVVTNSGNVALSGPFTVSDDQATDESCPATASLAPGDSITCTATSTISQADLNAGSLTNVADATNGTITSNQDTATVNAAQGPALSLVKSASPATFAAVGDVISYDFVVTNSGNVSLAGPVSVADDQATDESCPAVTTVGDLDANLDPGESLTCTASSTIVQADLDAGTLTNTATATVDGTTSNQDTATVNAAQGPALSLVKSASPATFEAVGDVISYDYVVTNNGNVSLAGPVTVADDRTSVTCPDVNTVGDLDADLDPGESLTCTASSTIVQADLDSGILTNTATASTTNGTVSSNVDSASVTNGLVPTPAPTAAPTPPATDVIPATAPVTATYDGLIGAWLLLASVGALAGILAFRRGSTRGRLRGRQD